MSINDLPDEILEQILLYLDLDDRKSALRVCRRWSLLKPFDWAAVALKLMFSVCKNSDKEKYYKSLLSSNRCYRQINYYFGNGDYPENFNLFIDVLRHFNRTVERLDIIMNGDDFNLQMFAQLAALGANLRHLKIDYCKFINGGSEQEIAPMLKLEEISLGNNILEAIPNLKDITPNIKRVQLEEYDDFEELSKFLSHVRSGLVELLIRFESYYHFPMVCELEFPGLVKLELIFTDGTEPDSLDFNDFVQRLPERLLDVSFLNSEMQPEDLKDLCQRCTYLQRVTLSMDFGECFPTLCRLKHLKQLTISCGYVAVPTVPCPQSKTIECLQLTATEINNESEVNLFIRNHLPNLTALNLMNVRSETSEKFELLRILGSNIETLQRLEVWQWEANLNEFLEFCVCAPRELTFHCFRLMDMTPFVEERQLKIPVQKFTLNVLTIRPLMLRKIVSSMSELRFLELMSRGDCTSKTARKLEEDFPRLKIKSTWNQRD